MYRFRFLLVALFGVSSILAQESACMQMQDTIRYTYRSGSARIDSLDLLFANQSVLVPGGAWFNPFGVMGNDYVQAVRHTHQLFPEMKRLTPRFTALPHLGFMYTFGSSGAQILHTEYQQAFRKNRSLQVDYARASSRGAWRNSSFKNGQLRVLYRQDYKRYLQETYFYQQRSERGLNGGYESDSLLPVAGLEFIPVNRPTAESTLKQIQTGSSHYFALNHDSLIKHGVLYHIEYRNQNRVYTDLLNDTLAIRDQFQWAQLSNRGGYFFRTNRFRLEATVNHAYWRFQNGGVNLRDTSEVSVQGGLYWQFGKHLVLQSHQQYYLVGATNQWISRNQLRWTRGLTQASIQLRYEQTLPEVFQRHYTSSVYSWQVSDLSLQRMISSDFQLNVATKVPIQVKASWLNWNDRYVFENGTWTQNSPNSNTQMMHVAVRTDLAWKGFQLQPEASFVHSVGFAHVPQWDLRARGFWHKRMFAAQKFHFIIGADVRYRSNYAVMRFLPELDLYQLDAMQGINQTLARVDFFTGFEIDEFRFYLKVENLDYLWNNRQYLEQFNVPISPQLIRLGILWDFFN